MLGKWILWALLVIVVLLLFRLQGKARQVPEAKPKRAAPPAAGADAMEAAEPMLVCAYCGVHFPQSEAVYGHVMTTAGPPVFCSTAHWRAAITQDRSSS